MPICGNKACKRRGQDLPDSEFRSYGGKQNKHCNRCLQETTHVGREARKALNKTANYTSGMNGAISTRVNNLGDAPIKGGDPPKFNFEWEAEQHREWLRGLAKLALQNDND